MKMKKTGMYLMMALLVCVFASGCASKATKPYKHSGFLSDYSNLEPDPDGSGEICVNRDVDLTQYNKVLLERIMVWYKEDSEHKGIDPTELKMLTDYFHEAIVRELGDAYPVVTEPGPGVMRARIAITELVPAKPAVSVVVLVTPYASVADLASGAVSDRGVGSPPYLGDTAVEIEVLDSETNEQLGAYVERKLPKKFDLDTSEGTGGAVKKAADSYFDSYSDWGHTKNAFDYWAKGFRMKLDELCGGKTPEGSES
jgi:hypothetical protein